MDIKKYIDYFHDGGFFGVKRKENNMELFLQSCGIESDEPVDRKLLSEEGFFRGKLSLTGIKRIKVDDEEDREIPWKKYDHGEILDLEIDNNKVFFLIEWKSYPPPRTNDVSKIEIEAEEIDWENIPNLPDDCCNEDRKL
jgi:hypothetical protein